MRGVHYRGIGEEVINYLANNCPQYAPIQINKHAILRGVLKAK